MKHHLDRRADDLIERGAGDGDDLLTSAQLARWFQVSDQWPEIGRSRGFGPPFIKIGGRVRYCRADVLAWLEARKHVGTTEYANPTRPRGRAPGSRVVEGKVLPPKEIRS